MSEARLNVRVDDTVKKQAEAIFNALGMNLSTGINIFLTQVVRARAIPFVLELSSDPVERHMQETVKAELSAVRSSGAPVALYDSLQNRPFLEYPDGRKVYDLE